MHTVVDLFAGPGGWDVAARELGIHAVGIEFDHAACLTRRAAGLPTIEGDVRDHRTLDHLDGLIASPPCPTFSMAGDGSGRGMVPLIVGTVLGTVRAPHFPDVRTELVLEPLYWIKDTCPDWVALEQVAPVLPIWEAYADVMRDMGYHVATGLVNAEQYGVPQTRRRAVLLARRDRPVALPTPTHSRYHTRSPDRLDAGVEPWVTMADVLPGVGPGYLRSNYGTGGDPRNRGRRAMSQPAPTVTSKINRHRWMPEDRPVSIREAAALQTFPADHPFQGGRGDQYQQIGNAIPPLLAGAVLSELVS